MTKLLGCRAALDRTAGGGCPHMSSDGPDDSELGHWRTTRSLQPRSILFYAGCTWGSDSTKMQRLVARLLLLFVLAGSVFPLALATTAAPLHACCIRKAHQCHSSGIADSDQLVLRSTGCCNHDCCRAVTTRQPAHPQPSATPDAAQHAASAVADSHLVAHTVEVSTSQSTRAPPCFPTA
jgi:hypothetical protein